MVSGFGVGSCISTFCDSKVPAPDVVLLRFHDSARLDLDRLAQLGKVRFNQQNVANAVCKGELLN